MGKLGCHCGYEMSDVSVPTPCKFHLLTDSQLCNIDYIVRRDRETDPINDGPLDMLPEIWVCKECGSMTVIQGTEYRILVPTQSVWKRDMLTWLKKNFEEG